MRKRKEKPECSKPVVVAEGKEDDEDEERGNEGNGFFSCYLLTSVCPRYKGHTYIGFTVNPKRRIRQHNGEIGCGAWRTKRKRPWEMVLCIYGFPTNVSALQFEWAWQHPNESLAVRSAAASFKSLSGVANKVKLAYTMLTLPSWSSLNITVNYFSTKYMKNAAGCPSLPEHMKVQVSPINELPCYSEGDQGVLENEDDWEYNREYEEICSFRAYGSWQKEVSSEIPQKSIDEQTGADENFDKELEDDEQVPPSCTWSDIVAGTGTSETEFIIEDREERQSDESSMNLQQLREKNIASEIRTETSKLSSCNNGRPSEYEVIVIDVSTPSPPDYRTSSHRFKSRVTTSVRSEFIDLTKSSPTFIQL